MPVIKTETRIDYVALAIAVNKLTGTNYDSNYVRNVHKGRLNSKACTAAIEKVLLKEQARA